MDRCKSVSDHGIRCGLNEGHSGSHYAVPPTGEVWTKGDGKNACEYCGRRVRLRQDGRYPKHNMLGTGVPCVASCTGAAGD